MIKTLLNLSIFSIIIASCSSAASNQYTYQQPEKVDDGFEVGTLTEVNLDEALLETAVDNIKSGQYNEIHSLLIYKDGKIVVEEYFPGHDYQWDGPNFHGAWTNWDRDKAHNIHSVGKSITAACIGIAIEQGFIKSVEQSIFDYLPNHQHLSTNGKENITIEHLLAMSSGLEWDEWGTSYSDEDNDVIKLWVDCDDPVASILEKPLVSEPGSKFTYSGGNSVLLGEIIKNATGMDIEAFSAKNLFEPLEIEAPEWQWINDTGVIYAGGDQRLTPRAMLKFGATYLNQGVWDGRQVVSQQWVENSETPYSGRGNTWFNHTLRPIPPGDTAWGQRGYSYAWWTHEFSHSGEKFPAYWALGWGSQKIIVLAEQDAVVVFTGGNYTSADPTGRILENYVIPAFE